MAISYLFLMEISYLCETKVVIPKYFYHNKLLEISYDVLYMEIINQMIFGWKSPSSGHQAMSINKTMFFMFYIVL